jgi:hypothetical protein
VITLSHPADLDPLAILQQLSAVWSPDLDAYASGKLDASRVRCVLCTHAPCDCPPFGSAAYFALINRVHGRPSRSPAPLRTCSAPECPLTAHVGEHPAGIAISDRGTAAGGRYSHECIVE